MKNHILDLICRALWAMWTPIAYSIGKPNPDHLRGMDPDGHYAWTDTRPRAHKLSNWIMDLTADPDL